MKKILIGLFLFGGYASAQVQTYTLSVTSTTIGFKSSTGVFSEYPLGSVSLAYSKDSVKVQLLNIFDKENVIMSVPDSVSHFTGFTTKHLLDSFYSCCMVGSGSGGGGGTPANPSTSVQFNNAGSFGGDADFFWDGTAVNVRVNGAAVTTASGVILSNTTTATSGVPNQYPPNLTFLGQTYNNSTSVTTGSRIKLTSTRQTTSVRPAMAIEFTQDGSTWTPFLSLTPYAAAPLTTLSTGLAISSGNFSLSSGNINLGGTGSITSNDKIEGGFFNAATTQTAVSASTSGTATFTQPFQGFSYKKVIIYLDAVLGTASYTFPAAFTHTPAIVTTDQVAAAVVTTLSTSAVEVTGATTTGFIILEGW